MVIFINTNYNLSFKIKAVIWLIFLLKVKLIMIILFNILSYFLKVNKTNSETIKEQSYKIPAFILIFSPHCPHCTAVHPSWEELMKKYETDSKIIVGECNAIEYRQQCKSLFEYTGYPTFIILSRGRAKSIYPQRSIESFINEAERLKMIDHSISCSTFQTEFDNNYPAFILSNNKTTRQKCDQLQEIADIYPPAKLHLYLNSSISKDQSFVALTSPNNYVKYEGKEDSQMLVNFLQELMMVPFGDWNYSDASLYNRRIGLFIHSHHNEYLSFERAVSSYSSNFSLCKIDISKFSKIFPRIKLDSSILPAFAVSNKEKTKFFILKNVLRDKRFQENLRKSAEGKLDKTADLDLTALFPIQNKMSIRSKIIDRSNGKQIKNRFNKIKENKINEKIEQKLNDKKSDKKLDEPKSEQKLNRKNKIKYNKDNSNNNENKFDDKNKVNLIDEDKQINTKNDKSNSSVTEIQIDDKNKVKHENKDKQINTENDKSNNNIKNKIDDKNKVNHENKDKQIKKNDETETMENQVESKNEAKIRENGKIVRPTAKFVSKLATTNFKVFISITVVILLTAVIAIMRFLNNTTSKIE